MRQDSKLLVQKLNEKDVIFIMLQTWYKGKQCESPTRIQPLAFCMLLMLSNIESLLWVIKKGKMVIVSSEMKDD